MFNTRKTLRTILLALATLGMVLLTGCSAGNSLPAVTVERQDWTSPDGQSGAQLLTQHYELRVTSRDALLQQYLGPFMETAFNSYSRTIRPSRQSTDRMMVYLFGTRDEWASFTRSTFPQQARVYLHIHAGGFVDQLTAMAVIHDLGRDRTLSLLAHEGFHQYAARYLDRPLPAWLGEGLACQSEAFVLHGDRPVFTPTKNYIRRSSLREALTSKNGMIPLSDLLRMNAGDAVVETGQQVRSYYAQVWSLILFLQQGADKPCKEGFRRLLEDAGTDRLTAAVGAYRATTPDSARLSEGEIIFRHYITEDLATSTSRYIDFARSLVY